MKEEYLEDMVEDEEPMEPNLEYPETVEDKYDLGFADLYSVNEQEEELRKAIREVQNEPPEIRYTLTDLEKEVTGAITEFTNKNPGSRSRRWRW